MRKYETIFVLQPQLTEEEIQAQIDRVKEIIDKNGKVESVEQWGLKTLAYKIANTYTEGYYVLVNFEAERSVLDDLEHYYKITDAVIRSIIVSKEKKK